MKMRTDVLWEPDKTDEHDRLLSRFEDDIMPARTDGQPMRDGHPFVISCTDNNQRMRDRIRRKPKPGKERTNESGSERIPYKQPRSRSAAGREQARAVKTMREYHETVSILENELDANDYQSIMGRPHPWKIL